MEKLIQEFRIIETDDGFRIEIKGDKERLRNLVMNLDPRRWMHSHGPHGGLPPFARLWKMRAEHRGWGPFGFAWGCCEDDEEEDELPRRKREQHHHPEHGGEETGAV